MIILGISHLSPATGLHDLCTALVVDGKLVSSVSEDRLNGIKHSLGYPSQGIRFCLQKEGIRLSDVDKVVVGFSPLKEHVDTNSRKQFSCNAKYDTNFRDHFTINTKKPLFYDHEYIHAKTGYFLSGFKRALAISLDGGGVDGGVQVSGGIFIINEGQTEILKIFPLEASLGHTYGAFTEACGFRMTDGEGKTMCLAPLGENESLELRNEIYEKASKIFPKYNGINYVTGGIELPLWAIYHNTALAIFGDPKLGHLLTNYSRELIAWAAQKLLEEQVIEIVSSAVETTGIKNVILTGGIFYNMIVNMKVREELEKRNCSVFFNPIAGDTGNAAGAAIEEYYQQTGKYDGLDWLNLSLGPEYDNHQIISALERHNMNYSKVEKISTTIDLIEKSKTVGWFQGAAELGPRGLGNRSILSRADDKKFKDLMNERVKHREPWRPFCPTIIKEKSDYFLENNSYAPYMILGFRTKHSEEIPAVNHIDGTTRPQTLDREYNKEFYDVVKGMNGVVLNTSLNLTGDPINTIPDDAILSFKYSEMDALVIGDYLIKR